MSSISRCFAMKLVMSISSPAGRSYVWVVFVPMIEMQWGVDESFSQHRKPIMTPSTTSLLIFSFMVNPAYKCNVVV